MLQSLITTPMTAVGSGDLIRRDCSSVREGEFLDPIDSVPTSGFFMHSFRTNRTLHLATVI
jgi:hypothetical protein